MSDSNFTLSTLGDISRIITGPFGSQLHKSDYVESGHPLIMPQNIDDRTLDYSKIAYISDVDAKRLSRYAAKPNDIVYSRRGDIEKHAFITEEGAFCGTGCFLVRFISAEVIPLFISYFLNLPESKQWLVQKSVGSNMMNLNVDILKAVPIRYPEIQKQNKIAKFLSALDRKISLNNAINTELENTARTLYDYWFMQFDFPDANGNPYKSSGGAMVWSDELKSEIPQGWKVGKLCEILIENKILLDTNVDKSEMYGLDLSIMPTDTICLNRRGNADDFESNQFKLNKFDLLFGSIRPYLRKAGFASFDGAVNGTIINLRSKKTEYYSFGLCTLTSEKMFQYAITRSNGNGTRMPTIKATEILDFNVAYSDEVLERFHEAVQLYWDKIIANINQNFALIELRDFLMPLLMNGQVRITTAEPAAKATKQTTTNQLKN